MSFKEGQAGRVLGAALFLLLCMLIVVAYARTLAPSVPGGDSGEFITTAHRLGVPHPPGYPLYTLIAHAFTYLPAGSIAGRVNLASAVFGLGAAIFIFLLLQRWIENPWAAFLGAGLFAFSPSVWRYSVVAEAFALNNLLLAAFLYVALRYWQSRDPSWIAWIGLTLGLGVAHHHTLMLVALPAVGWLWIRGWREPLRPRALGAGLAMFALGMTPYLYLPWASSRRLLASWGDLTDVRGFFTHFFRTEYGSFQLVAEGEGTSVLRNLSHYVTTAFEELLYVGVLLALWAVFVWLRGKPLRLSFSALLLSGLVLHTLVFCLLSDFDLGSELRQSLQSRFYLAPNLLLCLLAARGAVALLSPASRAARRLLPLLAVGLVLAQLGLHYRQEDRSNSRALEELGRAMLGSLPPNALFLVRGDVHVNTVRYLQACEGYRTDVRAVPLSLVGIPWMQRLIRRNLPDVHLPDGLEPDHPSNLRRLLEANSDAPVFVGFGVRPEEARELEGRYRLWNLGLFELTVPAGQSLDTETYLTVSATYAEYEPPTAARHDPWSAFVLRRYWKQEQARAEQLSLLSVEDESGFRLVRHAAALLERLLRVHPEASPRNHKTLAFAYWKLGEVDPGYRKRMADVLEAYIARNPDDPDNERNRALIESARNE